MGEILKRLRREGRLETKVIPSESSKRAKRGFRLFVPKKRTTTLDKSAEGEQAQPKPKPQQRPTEPWDSFERVHAKALELAAARADAYTERDVKKREEGKAGKVEGRVLRTALHQPNGAALRRARETLLPQREKFYTKLLALKRWRRAGLTFQPAPEAPAADSAPDNPPF